MLRFLAAALLIAGAAEKVDYRLTDWGQALCPALDAILKWAERPIHQELESTAPHGERRREP
ncbi:hypothetical protein AU476_32730 [Cupriavidus sp. UYMSc13B]|nr:hypothetical protein AU476_32730 [Cupriavidus sp. UYMSc13B]